MWITSLESTYMINTRHGWLHKCPQSCHTHKRGPKTSCTKIHSTKIHTHFRNTRRIYINTRAHTYITESELVRAMEETTCTRYGEYVWQRCDGDELASLCSSEEGSPLGTPRKECARCFNVFWTYDFFVSTVFSFSFGRMLWVFLAWIVFNSSSDLLFCRIIWVVCDTIRVSII